MQRLGVCEFDDPDIVSDGWASIEGGDSFRVSGHHELRMDVLWVTNIKYTTYKAFGFINTPHIWDAQYFRSDIGFLSAELGLHAEVQSRVSKLSQVLNRVLWYSQKTITKQNPSSSYRFSAFVGPTLLPRECKKPVIGPLSSTVNSAIRESSQSLQAMVGSAPLGSKATSMVFSRSPYYSWILSQPLPGGGQWKVISAQTIRGTYGYEDGRQIPGTFGLREVLIKLAKNFSCFFKIKMISQDKDMAAFQTFGASRVFGRKTLSRSWATLPEILHMLRFSKLEITEGVMTESMTIKYPEGLVSGEPNHSFSKGLLLENIFSGMSSPIGGASGRHTAVGSYLRSYDRIACARAAEQLYFNTGITIGSFGTGKVTAYITPSDKQDIKEYSLACGLLPTEELIFHEDSEGEFDDQ